MPQTIPFRQTNFAGGYLSPQLLGRTDTEKYRAGLAQVRNMFGNRTSGMQNRGGCLWCGPAKNQTVGQTQLMPFVLSNVASYELEIATGAIRPWKNGANIPLTNALTYLPGIYAPPGAAIFYVTGGTWWYTKDEQFNLPVTVTVTAGGGYAAGALVTLTASRSIWNAQMAATGATVRFYVPGANTVTVTLSNYQSGTVIQGTVDSAVPAQLQAHACVRWSCTYPIYGVTYLGDVPHPSAPSTVVLTITSGSSYQAGTNLTIAANVDFFSNEMVAQGTVIAFPTALGVIQATIVAFANGGSVTAVANLPIPPALQGVPTAIFSTPLTASSATFSPLGPTLLPGASFPPGSPTLAISTATSFQQQQLLTLTASANVFTAPQVAIGTAVVIHDGLGNTVTLTPVSYISPTQITAQSSQNIPANLQNMPSTFWSYATVAPAAGPWWYALTNGVIEIPTAMAASTIGTVRRAQHNDIVRMASQAMATIELDHVSDTQWPLFNWLPTASIAPPTNLTAQIGFGPPSGSTLHTFQYGVTAISAATGEESVISNPVTCLGNPPSDGVAGNGPPNTVAWAAVPGAASYKVYLLNGSYGTGNTGVGVPGLVGTTTSLAFADTGLIPNEAAQPPVPLPILQTINDYPAVCGFFGQRFLIGNTANQPQSFWGTRVQQFANMNESTPLQDDDAFLEVLAGNEVQFIEAFVDLGKLIIHTSNAEYVCQGSLGTGALTASAVNAVVQGGNGATGIQPVVIGNTDIYIQALGNIVRDFRFDIYSNQYNGKDISIFTPDLFIGRTVVQMAWQQVKDSIVWMVMSDGSLLTLTYIREENVWEWGTHDTGSGTDAFLGVICVPESGQDVVYVLVDRNGTVGIEKIAKRDIQDTAWLTDALFTDGGQVFDGRNATATTLTLATQTGGWTAGDVFTLTASAPTFAAADAAAGNAQGLANVFLLRQVSALGYDTSRLYFVTATYISSTQIQVTTNAAVPAWAQAIALTTWGKAVHAFSGITQLNGRAIAILGDGSILASPLNPQVPNPYPTVTVAGGAFVIPGAQAGADPLRYNAMVVCAGLPMVAQMATLPLENQKGDSILGRQIKVDEITATFYQSRGGFYGQLPGPGDPLVLKPWKQRRLEALGSPTALFSGSVRVNALAGNWGVKGQGTGQVVIQQPDPLPLGISGITTVAEVGD